MSNNMTQRGLEIATDFMLRESRVGIPYDTIREAGEKAGYEYYHYFCATLVHHKLGRSHFVKVNILSGQAFEVSSLDEIRWATHQEIVLNNF